ncbi:hypothetical protein QWA68_012712 [Fusarium oxysporum]|nr:hypothetical protein QWA68_012712 [Fusarium oxysporum]
MSTINILVRNKSGANRAYFLFVEPPTLSGGDGPVFSNVYITAPQVPSDKGTASFTCVTDYFAVTGTSPGQKLGSKVQVTTGDWAIVKINQDNKLGSSLTMNGDPGNAAAFDSSALEQKCEKPGSFSIRSVNFKVGNGANQFIGLGAQDALDTSNIIPVATVPAVPGTTAFFTPKAKYYISWGTYLPGQIVDITTIADPAEIDFTGKAATKAKVEHNLDGTWSVTYN